MSKKPEILAMEAERERLKKYEVDVPEHRWNGVPQRWRTYPGACYRKCFSYILDHPDCMLVHGQCHGSVGHAWIECPGGVVFDGVRNRFYDLTAYYQVAGAIVRRKYSQGEAIDMTNRTRHHGPWEDGE